VAVGDDFGSGLVASATVRRVGVVLGTVAISVVSGTVAVEQSTFRGTGDWSRGGVNAFYGAFRVSGSTFDGVGLSASQITDVSVTRSTIRNADTALKRAWPRGRRHHPSPVVRYGPGGSDASADHRRTLEPEGERLP
jgi:hypothetical protein